MTTQEIKRLENDEISLGEIVEFLFRIKYFLLLGALCAGIGAYLQRSRSPHFLSSAIVQVQKPTSNPMQALSDKLSGLGGSAGGDNITESTKLFFVSPELYRSVAKRILAHPNSQKIQKDLAVGSYVAADAAFQTEGLLLTIVDRLGDFAGAEIVSKENIRIWVKCFSPDTAITVVNLIQEEGVAQLAKNNLEELDKASEFIASKIKELETRIRSRQNDVLSLREKMGMTSSQVDIKDMPNPTNRLRDNLASAETEFRQRENLLSEIKPRIDAGQADYATVTKFEKLQEEKKYWASAIRSFRSTLKAMEENDKGSSGVAQNMMNTTREIEFEYRFYGELKGQLLQTDMMKISVINRVKPLEAAGPSSTYKDSGSLSYLVVASALAILLTALMIFALESAYPAVRNRHMLHGMGMSFLGEIPSFDRGEVVTLKKLIGAKSQESHLLWKSLKTGRIFDSPETMVFGAIRSKLLHLRATGHQGVRTICVTSPKANSGKTMITSNLACLLSIAKKKTLIIDCDLRRGGTTQGFELKDRVGLTDYLHGDITDYKAGITQFTDYLHVMPRGTQLLNPAELLSDERLPNLLQELKTQYEFIFLDAPPVLGVAETDIITKTADMVLLSIVQQETKVDDVKYTLDQMHFNEIKKIGYVLNRSGRHSAYTYYIHTQAA